MSSRIPQVLQWSTFLLLVAAPGVRAEDPPLGEGSSCFSDADCDTGLRCELPLTCTAIGCPSPEEAGGVCVPAEPTEGCTRDDDCASGFSCVAPPVAICAPRPCAEGEDCPEPDCASPDEVEGECLPTPPSGECMSDDDCGEGFSCIEEEVWPPCAPPCDEADPNCDAPAPCEPVTLRYCAVEPNACERDADCGEGEVCETYVWETCTGAVMGCDPSPDDAAGCELSTEDDEVCESYSESVCVPRYLATCEENTDCGEGFTCEAVERCVCEGSVGGGAEEAADGGEEDREDDNCTCEPTDERRCLLQDIPCESNDACPSGLICAVGDAGGGVAEPPRPEEDPQSADGQSGSEDDAGEMTEPDEAGAEEGGVSNEDLPETGRCVPPGFFEGGAGSTGDGDIAREEDGAPPASPDLGANTDDGAGGPAGSVDDTGDADGQGGSDDGMTDGDSGGFLSCQASGPAPSLLAWVGLLAFIRLRSRRRR